MAFVTENDIKELEKHGVNFSVDFPIFLLELHNYLKDTWRPEFHKDITPLKNGDIDSFNTNIDYPSWGGYQILDDSFTVQCENLDNWMSAKSKSLFGYFYGIQLR